MNLADVENLRLFLETPAGENFLVALARERCNFSGRMDETTRLVESGRIEGYEIAVRRITELAHPLPEPAKVSESYPELDDDSKWSE